MFKFFWNRRQRRPARDPSWRCDPLSHPAIERMSVAELADLPLARSRLPRSDQ